MRQAIAVAVLGVACALTTAIAEPAQAVGPGERAPSFNLPALGGAGSVGLASAKGKVVYLDFWATWCGPCLVSLPALEGLRQEFPADQFQILAVNLDREPQKAQAFLAKHGIGYPSAHDPAGKLPEQYGVETMPTSFLIDRDGVVRVVHRGFRKGDVDTLRAEIRKLVAAK
jgi:peroxiredoxin